MRKRRREAQPSVKTGSPTFKNPDDERARSAGQLAESPPAAAGASRRRSLL
jgi:hypothetical protein